MRLGHIVRDLGQHAFLRAGGPERQHGFDAVARAVGQGEVDSGLQAGFGMLQFQAAFEPEEFFEDQTVLRGRTEGVEQAQVGIGRRESAVREWRSSGRAVSGARGCVPARDRPRTARRFRESGGSACARRASSLFRRLRRRARCGRCAARRRRLHPPPGFRTRDASSPGCRCRYRTRLCRRVRLSGRARARRRDSAPWNHLPARTPREASVKVAWNKPRLRRWKPETLVVRTSASTVAISPGARSARRFHVAAIFVAEGGVGEEVFHHLQALGFEHGGAGGADAF